MRTIIGVMSFLAAVTVACVASCLMTAERQAVHHTYHPNGYLYDEWHTDGQGLRHGEECYWDDQGRLRMSYEWSHGETVAFCLFDAEGKVLRERREGSKYALLPVSR